MDEFAAALHVKPQLIYVVLGIVLIGVVAQINPKAGWILGLLAIIAIVTKK